MAAPPERIREVFHGAVDLHGEDREHFLDYACAGDPSLRAEVERLLGNDEREGDLLDSSVFPFPLELHTLSPGQVVAGRFEIVRFLGHGGMGEVYEAMDHRLKERLALKTLLPELLEDQEMLSRFRREILLSHQVAHRNVCRVHDLVEDRVGGQDLMCFTMELLGGDTLAAHLKPGEPLPTDDALPLVSQMIEGLAALHDAGIIHRDFKPGNVFLCPQNGAKRVVITDFGLARPVKLTDGAHSVHSLPGQVPGTPLYMAPEQFKGNPDDLGPATDIYALGLVIYEMAVGARPFPAEDPFENHLQKTQSRAVLPSERIPRFDPVWEDTILQCLQPEPQNRPQVATQVSDALERKAPQPRPKRIVPFLEENLLRNNLRASLTGALLAAIFLFVTALSTEFFRLPRQEGVARQGTGGVVATPRQHVAVLPIIALGEDPDLQVFADGLWEQINRRLSQFERVNEELLVVPPSEMKQQDVDSPPEALQKFGVNYSVKGSLQTEGEDMRLTLTLVDTAQMRELRSSPVTGTRQQVREFERQSVDSLAALLRLRTPSQPPPSPPSTTSIAGVYSLYLTGRGYLVRYDRPENIDEAIDLFTRALDQDPQYALAYAGLGEAYWRKYTFTKDSRWADAAVRNCNDGLAITDRLPEIHLTLGLVHYGTGRYLESLADFDRALRLDPSYADALLGRAQAYEALDRWDESESTFKAAIRLRPNYWDTYKRLAFFYYHRGRYLDAIEQFYHVIELTPDNAQAYNSLGAILYFAGDWQRARDMQQRSIDIEPNFRALSNLGYLEFEEGRYTQAIELYKQALLLNPSYHTLWGNLGEVYLTQPALAQEARSSFQKAVQLAEEALQVNAENPVLLSYLAGFYAHLSQPRRARDLVEEALSLDRANPRVLVRSAEVYEILGHRRMAIDLALKALDHGYLLATLERKRSMHQLCQDPVFQAGVRAQSNSRLSKTSNQA